MYFVHEKDMILMKWLWMQASQGTFSLQATHINNEGRKFNPLPDDKILDWPRF